MGLTQTSWIELSFVVQAKPPIFLIYLLKDGTRTHNLVFRHSLGSLKHLRR